jgi:hypothetical protein
LREPVSLRVVIVTSSDVGSGQDLIYSFVPTHYMYVHVKSLSNISIKTNFKQITRVESKLTNVYITLRVTTFCTWREVICYRSITNGTLHTVQSQMVRYIQFNHFQCHYLIIPEHFFWRNVDRRVDGNIENMPLEMILWLWIRDT